MRAKYGAIALIFTILALPPSGADEPPPSAAGSSKTSERVTLNERVTVEQIQIPFRVWPTRGDPSDCQGLTKDDFELWIQGQRVSDFEVSFDPVTSAAGSSGAQTRRHVVLWFDESHLVGPPEGNDTLSRSRAFTQATALLPRLPESVTVTLVDAFDAIEFFETGSPSAMAITLAGLRDRYRVPRLHERHITVKAWWQGLEDGARRLGMYSGHKELFFLTSVVPVDIDSTERQRTLSSLFAQNDVSLYPVRLVWELKGLAYGLLPLAEAGGGHMFANRTDIPTAVDITERMSPCHGVFITRNPNIKKKLLAVKAVLRRKGFDLTAPMAMEGSTPQDVEDTDLSAVLGIDRLDEGLSVTPSIETLRPSRDGGWESELSFRVSTTRKFAPSDLGPLRVYGAVWRKNRVETVVYKDFVDRRIPEKDVREIIGTGKQFRFGEPFRVPPGLVQIIVAVFASEDKKIVGSQRAWVTIPETAKMDRKPRHPDNSKQGPSQN